MKGLGTHVFAGFNEAPINFAPTFKYDVLHTIRGSKGKRRSKKSRRVLSEVEEHEKENGSLAPEDPTRDVESIISGTTSDSRQDIENGSTSSSESDSESRDPSFVDIAKLAAKTAKRRWYTAFKSTSSLNPNPVVPPQVPSANKASISRASSSAKKVQETKEPEVGIGRGGSSKLRKAQIAALTRDETITAPPMGARATSSMDVPRRPANELTAVPGSLTRSVTTKSGVGSKITLKDAEQEGLDIEDVGVYDTSSKQRVPSW